MKIKIFFLTGICIISISACKKECYRAAIVKRDCTGTYIEHGNNDYAVCNYETLVKYANGETINASFDDISFCDQQDTGEIKCMMVHPTKGWVKISSFK